jgi:hypothetical protein
MIQHHIQRQILRKIMEGHTHFGELIPDGVESNHFNYHLRQLIAQKYIEKTADGYCLTVRGKMEATHVSQTAAERDVEPHSVLLLAVRNTQGAWLLRQRKVEPNRNLLGFVHGEPVAGEPVTLTAKTRLLAKTGLSAEFTVRASGLITIYKDGALESFSHCILLVAENPSGELIQQDTTGENSWISAPDFSEDRFIPSMPLLISLVEGTHAAMYFDESYDV